jgi:hypothetical protein
MNINIMGRPSAVFACTSLGLVSGLDLRLACAAHAAAAAARGDFSANAQRAFHAKIRMFISLLSIKELSRQTENVANVIALTQIRAIHSF